jgi:hypothetical protein
MIDRYDVCNSGSLHKDDCGEWVRHEDAAARIEDIETHNRELIVGIFSGQVREQHLEARIAELQAQAINFRESIRKAALDSEHEHEILDLCWDSYFPEMPVAKVHRFVLSPKP